MRTERSLGLRSQLFVPANRSALLSGAGKYQADGLILDLEDSVPTGQKAAAREVLAQAVDTLSPDNYVSIRVNKAFDVLIEDLDAAVSAGPAALILPKVESAVEVQIMDALVSERELRNGLPRGSIEFQILVETCHGLANVVEIAAASERTVSLTLGVEDLASELEVEPGAVYFDVTWAHARVVMAARASRIAPYGLLNSLSNFTDLERLAQDVQRSRGFGFVGAFCIHPRQIDVLNRGFGPSEQEVDQARRIVAALEEAERQGAASTSLDGRMIDVPVADRARRVLRRAEGYGRRER